MKHRIAQHSRVLFLVVVLIGSGITPVLAASAPNFTDTAPRESGRFEATSTNFNTGRYPPRPQHDYNTTQIAKMFSRDADTRNESVLNTTFSSTSDFIRSYTDAWDWTYGSPTPGAAAWTRSDADDFPRTGVNRSIAPGGASRTALQDGEFIKDAYAALFAVTPSTRAGGVVVIPPRGTVIGAADFRVKVPADDTSGDRRVYWSLEHATQRLVVRVDGERIGSARGATVTADYTNLTAGRHSITVRAEFTAVLHKKVREKRTREVQECHTTENGTRQCHTETETYWVTTTNKDITRRRSAEYTTTRRVETPSVSGWYVARPDRRDTVHVTVTSPLWARLSFDTPRRDPTVRSSWMYLTGHRSGWRELTAYNDTTAVSFTSPSIPLRVYALPGKGNATVQPWRGDPPTNPGIDGVTGPTTVTATRTTTVSTRAPSTINPGRDAGDSITTAFTMRGDFVENVTTAADRVSVTAAGVAGGARRAGGVRLGAVVHHTSIDVRVLSADTQNRTARVRVTLRDTTAGEPISTRGRVGVVVVAGERVETGRDGAATVTVRYSATRRIHAEFHPGDLAEVHARGGGVETVYTASRAETRVPLDSQYLTGIWVVVQWVWFVLVLDGMWYVLHVAATGRAPKYSLWRPLWE